MSKERDALKKAIGIINFTHPNTWHEFISEVEELLAQPEQVPVAWITEWVHRYRNNDTPIMDRAVSFTKGGAPAVPNPNYIPLYLAPPKREPLSDETIAELWGDKHSGKTFMVKNFARKIEKAHGITGGGDV